MPQVYRSRYREYSGKYHTCQVPGCTKSAPPYLFCCHQHNAILPYGLRCDFQTAWTYRNGDPARFEQLRAEALTVWTAAAGLSHGEASCLPP